MRKFDPTRFHCAVMCVARGRAKTKVIEQIRAEGRKVSHYSSAEISQLAEAYFAAHMEELIPKAVEDCWTFPMFARYRQQQTQPQPQSVGTA